MTTYTVKQTGGDYSSLNAALAAISSNDIISIEGEWTVDDTTACTISSDDSNVTVEIGDSDSAHNGYWDTSEKHYRLVVTTGHALTVNGVGAIFDGLAVKQNGSGVSDEGFRVSNNGTTTIKNCLITSGGNAVDQDGVYSHYTKDATIVVENCTIWGWTRRGIGFDQTDARNGTTIYDINSCTIWDNGDSAEALSCGIGVYILTPSPKTVTVSVHNCIILGHDYHIYGGDIIQTNGIARITKATIDVSYSIDSDGSIGSTGVDDNAGNLTDRTPTDVNSPGAGDWVIFKDITTSPYDLRLDGSAYNDAQDMHTTDTAEGMTIPSVDILDTSRPQNVNYDCGAFEVISVTHELTGVGIISSPSVGVSNLGQTHTLGSVGLQVSPYVTFPQLKQTHILVGVGVETGVANVGISTIGQTHILGATELIVSPLVGTPAVGQTHVLIPNSLESGAPILGTPLVTQNLLLYPEGITTSPIVESPSIGQTHILVGSDISTQPVLGEPDAGTVYSFQAIDITVDPAVGIPELGLIYNLTASDLIVSPVTGTPLLISTHILSAVGVVVSPVVGSPELVQKIRLFAEDITVQPTINKPLLGQNHLLDPGDIEIPFVSVGSPHDGIIRTGIDTVWSAESIGFLVVAGYIEVMKTYYKPEIIFSTEE